MHPDPIKCYLLPGANQVHALNVYYMVQVLHEKLTFLAFPALNPFCFFIAGFFSSLMGILKNMPFMILLLSNICSAYLIPGIVANLPRYLEIHFRKPAYIANIIAGMKLFLALLASLY